MCGKIKGPTKLPLDDIIGILYGGASMTFTMHKKRIISEMRKKRHYEKHMETHFAGRVETFENMDDVAEKNELR